MGAVVDRLGPFMTLARVKAFLRIDSVLGDEIDEDTVIQNLIDETLEKADAYLNNPFEDSAGNELSIPLPVAMWVEREIAKQWERRTNSLAKNEISELGRQEFSRPVNWATEEWGELRLYRYNPGF